MAHTHVAVLRGGPSPEFEVSLRSGQGVIRALSGTSYIPRDIVITRDGEWLLSGRSRTPEEALQGIDVVFNALHGSYGEDGTVQRILERFGIPFTGSRSYASAIAMNKAMAKDHLRSADIALPRHFVVSRDSLASVDRTAHSLTKLFGPRFILKPVSGGSSLGVVRADNEHMLALALHKTLSMYEFVLVEECIVGREVTCAVVEKYRGEDLYALPSIEIIISSPHGFFDYDGKYATGSARTVREICPSSFDRETKHRIENIARTAHRTLGLSQYSRTDMIVGEDGHVYYLETNALPGLTDESLLPRSLDAVGATYRSFIDHLLTDALHSNGARVR